MEAHPSCSPIWRPMQKWFDARLLCVCVCVCVCVYAGTRVCRCERAGTRVCVVFWGDGVEGVRRTAPVCVCVCVK